MNLFKEYYGDLLPNFNSLNGKDKYYLPFPMAVFGTLRRIPEIQYNTRLMGEFSILKKGFIPHVIPDGIWLDFSKDASGVCEIYFYKPEQWQNMIRRVDALEGFTPGYHKKYGGYVRTLIECYVLPDEFESPYFNNCDLSVRRNLGISVDEWKSYDKVPVWLYSNNEVNNSFNKLAEDNPILWGV